MERYEKAIENGDTSFLLEKLEDGLYALNMGNLLSNQSAKVSITYSQVLTWNGDDLRYALPTVIAPRYGYCPFEAQQQPEYDYRVEYPLEFSMSVEGDLSASNILSPSHKIHSEMKQQDDKSVQIITLQQDAFLDRDFIVNIESANANTSSAVVQKDEEEYALIATFNPCFNHDNQQTLIEESYSTGRIVNILIDCSGSMQGDSINLAKKALLGALDELREHDFFSIIRFGNNTDNVTNGIIPANKINVVKARRQVRHIQADLGGTEIFRALKIAMSQSNPSALRQDCFLITDGEVWDNNDLDILIHQFKKKQQRVFSIGVGSSVSEKLVTDIATETHGSSEFVSPNEDMVKKIHRHFKRIFLPSLNQVSLNCGQNVIWQSTPQTLFVGDSVTIFARLVGKPDDKVTLSACSNNTVVYQETVNVEVTDDPQKSLVRQVAHEYLQTLEQDEDKANIAIQYQLMDETTAFIMVEENNVKDVQDFPVFRKVPQMIAAGWAGQGRIDNNDVMLSASVSDSMMDYDMMSYSVQSSVSEPDDYGVLDIPAFLRRQNDSDDDLKFSRKLLGKRKRISPNQQELSDFISTLSKEYKAKGVELSDLRIAQLIEFGLSETVSEDLEDIIKRMQVDEQKVLIYFVFIISKRYLGMTSRFKSKVSSQVKFINLPDSVKDLIDDITESIFQ